MFRGISLLVLAVLAVCAVGCAADAVQEAESSQSPEPTAPPRPDRSATNWKIGSVRLINPCNALPADEVSARLGNPGAAVNVIEHGFDAPVTEDAYEALTDEDKTLSCWLTPPWGDVHFEATLAGREADRRGEYTATGSSSGIHGISAGYAWSLEIEARGAFATEADQKSATLALADTIEKNLEDPALSQRPSWDPADGADPCGVLDYDTAQSVLDGDKQLIPEVKALEPMYRRSYTHRPDSTSPAAKSCGREGPFVSSVDIPKPSHAVIDVVLSQQSVLKFETGGDGEPVSGLGTEAMWKGDEQASRGSLLIRTGHGYATLEVSYGLAYWYDKKNEVHRPPVPTAAQLTPLAKTLLARFPEER
ncbi:MAG TPA: hypothetical protein VN041_11480 [Microbacterium sp.]|nr:hypothetical protein [Microbacterium sp.]